MLKQTIRRWYLGGAVLSVFSVTGVAAGQGTLVADGPTGWF